MSRIRRPMIIVNMITIGQQTHGLAMAVASIFLYIIFLPWPWQLTPHPFQWARGAPWRPQARPSRSSCSWTRGWWRWTTRWGITSRRACAVSNTTSAVARGQQVDQVPGECGGRRQALEQTLRALQVSECHNIFYVRSIPRYQICALTQYFWVSTLIPKNILIYNHNGNEQWAFVMSIILQNSQDMHFKCMNYNQSTACSTWNGQDAQEIF